MHHPDQQPFPDQRRMHIQHGAVRSSGELRLRLRSRI